MEPDDHVRDPRDDAISAFDHLNFAPSATQQSVFKLSDFIVDNDNYATAVVQSIYYCKDIELHTIATLPHIILEMPLSHN